MKFSDDKTNQRKLLTRCEPSIEQYNKYYNNNLAQKIYIVRYST